MYNKTIILIPAYEPPQGLIVLLQELKKKKLEIVIVNDGSNSNYDDIFKEASKYAHIITHRKNKGKGIALKTGLEHINKTNNNKYIVITMDCDGQHSIKDAITIGNYAKENPNQLVLGKRLRSKKTPIRSRIGNEITRFIYRLTTGVNVYDTQTGLRAFSNELVPFMLDIEGERFEYEMNVLLKCPSNKIKIKEIEIETIYHDNNSHSHFKTIKDSTLVIVEIFKFLISSMISFIIDYLLYILLLLTTNKLILSNIIARIISATVNYNLNKKIVFKNKNKNYNQILKYLLLAIVILTLNTSILSLLVNNLSLNKYLAKIITEIILISFSWLIQKKVIFTKENK